MRVHGRRAAAVAAPGLLVAAGCNYLGAPPVETGAVAVDVAVGDLDGDHDVDLVTSGDGGWAVLENDGSAHFTVTEHPYDAPGRGDRIELSDLEGDGDLDVVQTILGDFVQRVEVQANDGSGGFIAVPQSIPTWSSGQSNALGDVTGDGVVDLLVLHEPVNERVDVYPGDGHGAFGDSIDSVTGLATGDLAVGDVDGDGDLDLGNILVTYGADGVANDLLQVAYNDGSGRFGPWSSGTVVGHSVGRLHDLTDVDGDGVVDAVIASWGKVSPPAIPGDVKILPGDGQGGFGPGEQWVGPGRGVIDVGEITLADMDGDGVDDIVADTAEGALVVYRDLPGFEEREFGHRGPVGAADFDGDGKVDAVVGSTVYLNKLTGR
jgi:hypothetical protein